LPRDSWRLEEREELMKDAIGYGVAIALLLAGVAGPVKAGSNDQGARASVGVGADVGGAVDSAAGAAADAKGKVDAAKQAPKETKKAVKHQANDAKSQAVDKANSALDSATGAAEGAAGADAESGD
jgi:hypothetical protein